MRREFALIDQGVIANIVAGDENFDMTLYGHHDAVVEIPVRPDIGWVWSGAAPAIRHEFVPPPPEAPPRLLAPEEVSKVMSTLAGFGISEGHIKKIVSQMAAPPASAPLEVSPADNALGEE
jgi:hypothetical protein